MHAYMRAFNIGEEEARQRKMGPMPPSTEGPMGDAGASQGLQQKEARQDTTGKDSSRGPSRTSAGTQGKIRTTPIGARTKTSN